MILYKKLRGLRIFELLFELQNLKNALAITLVRTLDDTLLFRNSINDLVYSDLKVERYFVRHDTGELLYF